MLLSDDARNITAALHGRWCGTYGMVKCVAHEDCNPSLSLRDGEQGKLLVKCHAGCNGQDVLSELRRRGLLEEQSQQWRRSPTPNPAPRTADDGRAQWLWRQRRPLHGTLGERYLREQRNCRGALPATLGYLPARGKHVHAVIAAFGLPYEPEPGVLAISDTEVRGVQLLRLDENACKIGNAITVGRCPGVPIIIAPLNDLLGVAITEGIEDGLSLAEATGLGVWAAGGASRLPALAAAVPSYADWISLLEDDDRAGRSGVAGLHLALLKRRRWHDEQIERVRLGSR